MVRIKDFAQLDEAYRVDLKIGRNSEPEIKKVKVAKTGRVYVTDNYRRRFKESESEFGLESEQYNGEFLCPSPKHAEELIEYHRLQVWLSRFSPFFTECSLEQLRAVKEILEPDKEG